MDIAALDRRALDLTGGMVAAVAPWQWRLATPCPDWTLHGLTRHLISQNEGFAASARGDGDRLSHWRSGDLGDSAPLAFDASAAQVSAAFSHPVERLALPEIGVTVPAHTGIGFHLLDFVVHAWDIAVTIGAAWEPDDEVTAAALAVAERVPDAARGPAAEFAARIDAPPEASPRHRLLSLTGRDVSWRPIPC